MIYDTLENLHLYRTLSPEFARVIDYMLSTDLDALTEPRYDIGERDWLMVQHPTLKPLSEGKFEAHQRYADIQFAFEDGETIYTLPYAETGDWGTYNAEDDIIFVSNGKPGIALPMKARHFAIFFPGDAHMPCIGDAKVKKIVAKVALE